MSNEEIVVEIKSGAGHLIGELWERNSGFVTMKARKWALMWGNNNIVEVDDLIQAGYFGVLQAVKYFDNSKGYKFISYLDMCLKNEFRKVVGIYPPQQRDASYKAIRLDAPVGEEDNTFLVDLIPDELAEEPFEQVVDDEFLQYTRGVLAEAFTILGERESAALRGYFLQGKTYEDMACEWGVSRQRIRQICEKAIRKIRRSPFAYPLRALYAEFDGFDIEAEGLKHTGFRSWKESNTSSTERVVIMKIRDDVESKYQQIKNAVKEGNYEQSRAI